MSLKLATLALSASLLAAPALAQEVIGNAEDGAKVFLKCQTCHTVANEAGEVLAGKGAKTGPNLYGLPGRVAGTYPEFKYGESIVALGATGFTWNEADFVAYVADPAKFLKEKLDDKGAKSKMSFKLSAGQEDMAAYLATLK